MIKKTRRVLAIAIFIVALLVLLGRIEVTYLSKQTRYFQDIASKALGHPVEIQQVKLRWRGFYPLFILNDVLVKEDNNHVLMHVNQIKVGINFLSSLFHWEFIPGTLKIAGANITVFQDELGHWKMSGMKDGDSEAMEFNKWLEWLLSQKKIFLADIQLELRKQNKKIIPISIEKIELYSQGDAAHIEGDMSFLQPLKGTLHLQGQLKQSLRFEAMKAVIYIDAQNIDLASWLEDLTYQSWHVKKGLVNAKLWASWEDKQWKQYQCQLNGKDILLKNDKNTISLDVGPTACSWKKLANDAWQFQAALSTVNLNQKTFIDEPVDFIFQQDSKKKQIQVSHLSFSLINRFINQIPDLPQDKLDLFKKLHIRGDVNDLYFMQNETSWLLDANLKNINSEPDGKIPGAENLSGRIQMTPVGGFFNLDSHAISVTFPKVFRKTIFLDQAQGVAYWKVTPTGLVVQVDEAQALNSDGACYGRFKLIFSNQVPSPWISLVGGGQLKTLKNKSLYLPYSVMPHEVLAWLDQAIVPGDEKLEATVVLNGPLEFFPFDQDQGQFIVDANLENVNLQFEPMWPHINTISGNLIFHDRSMNFKNGDGRIYKSTLLENLEASIPQMGGDAPPTLTISGKAKTNIDESLTYIKQSPLNNIFKKRFSNLIGEGPLDLQLSLSLPLSKSDQEIKVGGMLHFEDDKLGFPNLEIDNLKGDLAFSERGMSSPLIEGTLGDEPLKISMSDLVDEKWDQTQVSIVGKIASSLFSPFFGNSNLENYISGKTSFNAVFNLYHAKTNEIPPVDEFILRSDLQGIEFNLPPPLAKKGEMVQAALLDVKWEEDGPLIHFQDGMQTQSLIRLKDNKFDRGVIAFNTPQIELPSEPGLLITGYLKKLDWPAWNEFIEKFSPKNQNTNVLAFPDFLRKIDLTIGTLNAWNHDWSDTTIQVGKENNTLYVQLKNNLVNGKVTLLNGLKSLRIRMDYVNIDNTSDIKSKLSPADFPILDFESENVKIGNNNLGKVQMLAAPTPQGLTIQKLVMSSGAYTLNASGQWNKNGTRSSSGFNGTLSSNNLPAMLKQWGLSPSIESRQASANFSLNWQGSPFDLNTASLEGLFDLNISKGVFTEVNDSTSLKIGLGRILTLLSLQSIQQRLQLNFSDLSNKGFDFSILKGRFTLNKGQAYTQDLFIDGPVAKIKISGRIGLATHDYDLNLAVTPYVTSSLPVIATIAGGPIVGAVAWVTDKILSPAVQKLTTYHYHLIGPWSMPVVEPKK